MLVRGVVTSNERYDAKVRVPADGRCRPDLPALQSLPRVLAFPVPKGTQWAELYDLVWLLNSGAGRP